MDDTEIRYVTRVIDSRYRKYPVLSGFVYRDNFYFFFSSSSRYRRHSRVTVVYYVPDRYSIQKFIRVKSARVVRYVVARALTLVRETSLIKNGQDVHRTSRMSN